MICSHKSGTTVSQDEKSVGEECVCMRTLMYLDVVTPFVKTDGGTWTSRKQIITADQARLIS